MFCIKCGKEIPEEAGFCPSCGVKIGSSTADTLKDTIRKASEVVSDTAKSAGKRVNEATNGKVGEYAQTAQEKAKETAKNFSADVKQAVQNKDAKGFFTRNKYRNTIIIAGIIVVLAVLVSIFSNGTNGQYEKAAVSYVKSGFQAKNISAKVIDKSKSEVFVEVTCSKDGDKYEILIILDKKTKEATDDARTNKIFDSSTGTKYPHADWSTVIDTHKMLDDMEG